MKQSKNKIHIMQFSAPDVRLSDIRPFAGQVDWEAAEQQRRRGGEKDV